MNRISPFTFLLCCVAALPSLAQTIPNLTPAVPPPPPITACGVSDKNIPDSTVKLMGQAHLLLARQNARRASSPRNICRIAVEIDSDTYLAYDKDTSAIIREVLTNIEATSKIFERDVNTQLVVVRIHIWKDTEPDPYRGIISIFTLLNTFVNAWNRDFKEVTYDKVCYFFTKPVTGAGGIALIGGAYSVSPLAYVSTIAHEFGHNFNSLHTHNCNWAGGPIDYCAPIEGNCYSASLEQIPDGTIMSYCNSVLEFHPLCRAIMTDHADKTLQKLTKGPDKAPALPAQVTLGRNSYLYWPGIAEAERYEIEVATDAAFGQKILADSSKVNGYDLAILKPGSWYARARSVNQFGVSAWSVGCQVRVEAGINNASPILLSPTQDQRLVPNNNTAVPFAVQSVDGATAYEWECKTIYPTYTSTSSFTTTQSTALLTFYQSGAVYWRARSWRGSAVSAWSLTRRFFRNQYSGSLAVPFSNTAPLSFPYSYNPTSTDVSLIRVETTLATDPAFERVVSQQQVVLSRGRWVGMLRALQPNTQYYLRTQELRATANADYPPGVLTEVIWTFRTGSSSLAGQWQFVNNETTMGLPQGRVTMVVPTTETVWLQLEGAGLFQLDPTKSTAKAVSQASTKGAIGNMDLYLDPNGSDGLWLTNAISANGGRPFTSARQIGRFVSGTENLSQRTVLKPNSAAFYQFTNTHRLFVNHNAVYVQQGDSLAMAYQVGTSTTIQRSLLSQSSVWMIQYNNTLQRTELVEFNALTKKQRIFSKATTPQLGEHLNSLAVDGLGNIWIGQTDPSSNTFPKLAKFNGQQWTNYPFSAVPFNWIYSFGGDAVGNLYVLGIPNNAGGSRLWRFDGQNWKEIGQLPSLSFNFGNMTVDGQGSVWWYNGEFQIVRFNPCGGITTPKLATTKTSLEVGETVTLKAEGCTSAIWSWSSAAGSTTDLLQKATNELTATPTANTTYRVRCYDDGCSGNETSLTVAVRPRLSVAKVNKTSFCLNDQLTATLSLTGSMEPTNQYVAVLKSASRTIRFAPVSATTEVSVPIASSLLPGRYVFYVESTQPAVRSRDSLTISIVAPALAKLSATRNTIEIGESTTLKAEGCTSAVWSWSSAAESKTNQLVQGSNELAVSPTVNTTYQVRCYDTGCSGGEAGLNLTVLPRLTVGRLRKANYCLADTVVLPITLTGRVEAGNQYRVLLRSATQSTTLATGVTSASGVSFALPATLPPGSYTLFAETSRPAVRSRDSVQISVAALPTAELTTTRAALVGGDSTQVMVTLTGTSPWRFIRWDSQPVQALVSPYTSWFKAASQASFNVSISSLSDGNCVSGTLKNTLALSLILGTEPHNANAFIVTPNPTTGIVTIEALEKEAIASVQVYDQTGRATQQFTFSKPIQKQVIDLSTLASGVYLLKVQTDDGQLLTWKVVKL